MPSQADLAAAFARMRQNNADAGAGIQSGPIDLGNVYGRNLGSVQNTPAPSFGANGSGDSKEPLWMKALTGISATGKVLTNQFSNWTDGDFNMKDLPFAESLVQGAQGQREAWADGKFGFGDIPGLGALYGIGSKGDGFSKTLTNLGAEEGGKVAKWGGLAGDVVFDLANLLTFGAGSAIKAGANAAAKASKLGLADDAVKAAGAAARNKAQNAIVNFDVPFTNITKQFGQKADIPLVGKYLQKSDATIGTTGSAAAKDLFTKLGFTSDQAAELLKRNYNVTRADDLTTQGWKHLQEQAAKVAGRPVDEVAQHFTDTSQLFDGAIPAGARNVADELPPGSVSGMPIAAGGHGLQATLDNLLLGGDSVIAGAGSKRASKARNTVDVPEAIADPLADFGKFTQDMGGKSALGRAVAKYNPFDARAFGSADNLARQSANDVRDTTTKISGQTRQANEQIAQVEKVMKGMSAAEQRAVIYAVQDVFPRGFDKASVDMAKVEAAAEKVRPILDQVGQRDLASGTISELRKNYFPHVLKREGIDASKLAQDPDIAKILGMTQANNFGRSRNGFQSIAEVDDAIAGLEKAAKADPAQAEALLAKADELRELYDTNVTSALGNRAYKSVRASAYADLFNKLEADGLMVRPSKTLSETKVNANSNPDSFKKLNADEAKAFGVPPGTMIQKDTFEGMKRVQDLFTSDGLNKLFENINSAVSVWKALVTSYVPAHYVNNFIGNIANNTLAGVKPASYRAAHELLKRMKSGKVSPEDQKIVQAAYDKGVFGSGFDSDFVKSQFKDDKKTLTEKLTNSLWAPKLKEIGNHQDDFARLSLFMHGITQTGSTDKAAALVRKYLFNYTERSHGDTFARAAMPFWMWTKNNLPLQIQGMMQQPRFYSTYAKIKDTFNEDVEGGKNKPYTTDNYLHLPGTDIGLPLRSLPMNDLGNTFGTGAGDTLRSGLGMLAPPFKAPFELGLNRQLFNNAPIMYEGEEEKGLGKYLLNQTGVLGKAANIADGEGNTLFDILGAIIGKPVEYK